MTTFTSSITGSVRVQTALAVPGQPNRTLGLAEIGGTQNTSDPNWNNARVEYCGSSDLVNGQGPQHGYFCNDHGDGNRDFGSYEGKVTTNGAEINVNGTWTFTGGTGTFSGITGKGSFTSKIAADGRVTGTVQGTYELAAKTAQAR